MNRMFFFTLDWIQFGFPFLEKQGATFTQTHQLLGRFQTGWIFQGAVLAFASPGCYLLVIPGHLDRGQEGLSPFETAAGFDGLM